MSGGVVIYYVCDAIPPIDASTTDSIRFTYPRDSDRRQAMPGRDAPPTERTPLAGSKDRNGSSSSASSRMDPPEPPSLATMVRVSSTHKLWDGWGDYSQQIAVEEAEIKRITKAQEQERGKHELLGEWRASSICSNDILSSCFYTIGLVTSYAGMMVRVFTCPAPLASIQSIDCVPNPSSNLTQTNQTRPRSASSSWGSSSTSSAPSTEKPSRVTP